MGNIPFREVAGLLRRVAWELLEAADEFDPPGRTAATTRAESCTCDVCGSQMSGLRWIGERCDVMGLNEYRIPVPCPGRYRLDPESGEELTTGDGRPMGVTLGDLAMQQAIRDFAYGDTDEVPAMQQDVRERPRAGTPEWEQCARCGGTVSPRVQFFNGGLCPACQPLDMATTYGGRP